MNNLLLLDFNDLYVIAVGVSMAYIVIERRNGGKSFFSFLSKMTNIVQSIALDYKTRPQQNEELVIAKIKYYLNSDKLLETTKGALNLVCQKAEDVMESVTNLEKWFKHKMAFHTKTDYLNVISCDSFIYGLFVLFVGALQNKCKVEVSGLLEWMLLFVVIGLFHCLVFERLEVSNKYLKIFQPNIFLHVIFAILFLIVGILYHDSPVLTISVGWLSIFSVIASFVGFITYLTTTLIANVILMVVMLIKIFSLKIDENVKQQRDDINRYQEELDAIDQELKNEPLDDEFTLIGGEVATHE